MRPSTCEREFSKTHETGQSVHACGYYSLAHLLVEQKLEGSAAVALSRCPVVVQAWYSDTVTCFGLDRLDSAGEERVQGDPRGPGGPPHWVRVIAAFVVVALVVCWSVLPMMPRC